MQTSMDQFWEYLKEQMFANHKNSDVEDELAEQIDYEEWMRIMLS